MLEGERLKILAADIVPGTGAPGVTVDDQLTIGTAQGLIRALRVQRAGKPAMDTQALLRGWPIPKGTRLG
jgi:methionyl-tRNA formyltransferase